MMMMGDIIFAGLGHYRHNTGNVLEMSQAEII